MKREDLQTLGLTDEQIEKIMAEHGKDVQSANAKAEKYKTDADKAKELQAKLDEIEANNLSDLEKMQKELEKATARTAELEKNIAITNQRNSYMEKLKLTGEQALKVVKDDGTVDIEALSAIVAEKETSAANAKEQEIAKGATNPGGGSAGGSGEDEKPADVKNAESLSFAGVGKDAQTARDFYK